MDTKVDGTPFSVLMQQAVKLKTHIHKIDRVKFDAWPKFYQNSTFVKDEQRVERQVESFDERMAIAERYKGIGDTKFKVDRNYLEAGLNYEWALGMFKWATPLDEDWRKKSLEDNRIREEEYLGESDEEKTQIESFRIACLLNLSRCYFKQHDANTAKQACDWALALDPDCEKALLLRARCLVQPKGHGATERDEAIADLERALICCRNEGRFRDEIVAFLKNLRRDKIIGKKADQKYAGLFERGQVYDPNEALRRKETALSAMNAESDETGRAELAAVVRLMHQYEEEGKVEEAAELRRVTEKFNAAQSSPVVDFRNPTPEMKEDAKSRGIDLDDPAVVEMIEQLQREKENPVDEKRHQIDAKLDMLSVNDMLHQLKKLQIHHKDCTTKEQLRKRLESALLDNDDLILDPPTKKKNGWMLTVLITLVLFAYRLYFSKLFVSLPLERETDAFHEESQHRDQDDDLAAEFLNV